jgi:ketosteroid isomerase-like protein
MSPEAELIAALYDCFNRRDEEGIRSLCDDDMAFYPVGTAEAVGRDAPYVGPEGLREYLRDIAEVWEELRIVTTEQEFRGSLVLVRGRVYARSRELGIRDFPVAWVWEIRDGLLLRGEVFPDPDQAAVRFKAIAA